MRLRRTLYLYARLVSQQLKAVLYYRADFMLMVVAGLLTYVPGFIFLWVVYARIPDIRGWKFFEVAFIYAVLFCTDGVSILLFDGVWWIRYQIHRGELDRFLVRPLSPIVQVISGAVGIHGLGMIILGAAMIVQASANVQLHWTPGKVVMLILVLISGVVIRISINLAANSLSFWTLRLGHSFPGMVYDLANLARYPITIYSLGVQALVTVVLPYAFISFFPAAYLFDRDDWGRLGLLSPVVAIYCAALSAWIFRRGLRRYESAGN